jgi:hypothetical protein
VLRIDSGSNETKRMLKIQQKQQKEKAGRIKKKKQKPKTAPEK